MRLVDSFFVLLLDSPSSLCLVEAEETLDLLWDTLRPNTGGFLQILKLECCTSTRMGRLEAFYTFQGKRSLKLRREPILFALEFCSEREEATSSNCSAANAEF